MTTPVNQGIDGHLVTFKQTLDRAVRQVSDPTGDTEFECPATGMITESDPLDATVDNNGNSGIHDS